ncbi:hypothetical protein H4Q26_000392 [Puccinia striiformis f. sp. tritici PST-130]|nr:hypothetical protein H4Q26_000392 [Puccinia striiformis f. sp. tritici PST-130]
MKLYRIPSFLSNIKLILRHCSKTSCAPCLLAHIQQGNLKHIFRLLEASHWPLTTSLRDTHSHTRCTHTVSRLLPEFALLTRKRLTSCLYSLPSSHTIPYDALPIALPRQDPKTATFKPDQTVEDDLPTSTEDLTVKDDMLTSSELDITKVKEENEKELPEDPGALSRSTTSGRTQPGKNPPRSSVLSWCSVNNVKKLALPTKAVEQSQSMQESPTTPTQAISPTRAAHPRIKFSDIGSILSLSIPEEGEEHASLVVGAITMIHLHPPRVARYGSFSTTSQADRSTLNSSVRTNNVPEAIHLNQSRLANPCLPDDVCLPNIDRFSKLDFNECDSNWMKYFLW